MGLTIQFLVKSLVWKYSLAISFKIMPSEILSGGTTSVLLMYVSQLYDQVRSTHD